MSDALTPDRIKAMTDPDELDQTRDTLIFDIEHITAQLEHSSEDSPEWEKAAIGALAYKRPPLRMVERKLSGATDAGSAIAFHKKTADDLRLKVSRLEKEITDNRAGIQLESQRLATERNLAKQVRAASEDCHFRQLVRPYLPEELVMEIGREAQRRAAEGGIA